MKRIYLPAILACIVFSANAQKITYNHDASKMNQVTVQEIGSGNLKPAAYYQLLHRKYRNEALTTNKLLYRTGASMQAYQQIDDAEALDSALIKRAEIEALNMTDRQVDLAWLAEGQKLQNKLSDYQRNINRILSVGGRASHQTAWKEHYNKFVTAINSTKEAYMPNSRRKKEYLRIYGEITQANEDLLSYIVMLSNRDVTAGLLNATYQKPNRTGAIAAAAKNRWRTAGLKGSGKGGIQWGGFIPIDPIKPVDPIDWGEIKPIRK